MKKDMQKLSDGEVATKVSARTLDADEMARALQQIPEAEREKLYYMGSSNFVVDGLQTPYS